MNSVAEELEEDGVEDRLVIVLNPGGPIELVGLSNSFGALSRLYERPQTGSEGGAMPKLFVTRIESGSIVVEIAVLSMLLGQAVSVSGGVMTLADFAARLYRGVKAFAGLDTPEAERPTTTNEAEDLREFIRPLTGKQNATLQVRHARFFSQTNTKTVVAEYTFGETELNRAAANLETALAAPAEHGLLPLATPEAEAGSRFLREVTLYFDQASRSRGREQGRTADKAIVPQVSPKPLPVYFRRGVEDLKEKMAHGALNPFAVGFIVDLYVDMLGDTPKAFVVSHVHTTIPID